MRVGPKQGPPTQSSSAQIQMFALYLLKASTRSFDSFLRKVHKKLNEAESCFNRRGGIFFEAPLCTLLEEFQMHLFNADVELNRFLTSASTFVCSERHAGVHPVHTPAVLGRVPPPVWS